MIPKLKKVNDIINLVIIMHIKQIYEIYENIEDFDMDKLKIIICDNMKQLRLKHYEEYMKNNNGARGFENPYSTENIANYLDMSKVHYKRLENRNDKNKNISLKNLIVLSLIYEIPLDEFMK